MDVLNCNVERPELKQTLSFADLRAKLFPERKKFDRSPTISEERYGVKTLEGSWFERRAVCVSADNDWRTVYNVDYLPIVNKEWKKNLNTQWDNKLNIEGLPRELLMYHGEEYEKNMTSTFDLTYNILPKSAEGRRIRTYNARMQRWVPEQNITQSYGNLTQFGLRDLIKKELYRNSMEGIAKCRWWTTYREEIGQSRNYKTKNIKQNKQFNKRRVNMNVADLSHFESPDKISIIQNCIFPFKQFRAAKGQNENK